MHEIEEQAVAREASLLPLVGVVTLLLAFFIVLNNASRFENDRMRAVVDSVTAAFDPAGRRAGGPVAIGAPDGESSAVAPLPDRLGTLVETAFPLGRVTVVGPDRIFLVEIPLGAVWREDAAAPTVAGRRFVAALAPLLGAPAPGWRYEIEAWLGASNASGRTLAIRRVAAFADALDETGMARGRVASGVDGGSPDRLRIVIALRSAAEAPPAFADVEAPR